MGLNLELELSLLLPPLLSQRKGNLGKRASWGCRQQWSRGLFLGKRAWPDQRTLANLRVRILILFILCNCHSSPYLIESFIAIVLSWSITICWVYSLVMCTQKPLHFKSWSFNLCVCMHALVCMVGEIMYKRVSFIYSFLHSPYFSGLTVWLVYNNVTG